MEPRREARLSTRVARKWLLCGSAPGNLLWRVQLNKHQVKDGDNIAVSFSINNDSSVPLSGFALRFVSVQANTKLQSEQTRGVATRVRSVVGPSETHTDMAVVPFRVLALDPSASAASRTNNAHIPEAPRGRRCSTSTLDVRYELHIEPLPASMFAKCAPVVVQVQSNGDRPVSGRLHQPMAIGPSRT